MSLDKWERELLKNKMRILRLFELNKKAQSVDVDVRTYIEGCALEHLLGCATYSEFDGEAYIKTDNIRELMTAANNGNSEWGMSPPIANEEGYYL